MLSDSFINKEQYNNALKELLTKGSLDLTDDETSKESVKDNGSMLGDKYFTDNNIVDGEIR